MDVEAAVDVAADAAGAGAAAADAAAGVNDGLRSLSVVDVPFAAGAAEADGVAEPAESADSAVPVS